MQLIAAMVNGTQSPRSSATIMLDMVANSFRVHRGALGPYRALPGSAASPSPPRARVRGSALQRQQLLTRVQVIELIDTGFCELSVYHVSFGIAEGSQLNV